MYALPTFTTGGYPPGNNVIIGQSSGGEVMAGGNGNDLLFGNGGNDDPFNGLGGDDLLVGGVDDDNMNGHMGNDVLLGEGGNDTLVGGEGNDILIGGAGNDTLNGGSGDDIFDFNAISDSGVGPGNRDVITDFHADADPVTEHDLIDLSGIDANTTTASDQAFAFVSAQNAGVVANSITWFQDVPNNRTIIQGDVDDGITPAADFQIELTGLHTLAEADFIL